MDQRWSEKREKELSIAACPCELNSANVYHVVLRWFSIYRTRSRQYKVSWKGAPTYYGVMSLRGFNSTTNTVRSDVLVHFVRSAVYCDSEKREKGFITLPYVKVKYKFSITGATFQIRNEKFNLWYLFNTLPV